MRRETGKPVLVGISASRLRLVSYPSQRYGWGLMSDMITGYSIAAVGRGMTKYITQLGEHQGKKRNYGEVDSVYSMTKDVRSRPNLA
jgi:hypothetical protein